MPSELRTKSLTLVACSADVARAICGDRGRVAGLCGFKVHADWPDSDLPQVLESYARLLDSYPDKIGWGVWLFCREGLVIGDGGFHGPPKSGRAQLGYSIVPEHRKRGYATEAVLALCDWAVKHGATSLEAFCAPENQASARVLERCGFREMPMPPRADGQHPDRKWVNLCATEPPGFPPLARTGK